LLGRLRDPAVELVGVADDGGGHGLRIRIDLALVELPRRAFGHVPLVEERERGLARLPAADGSAHASSSTETSTPVTVTPHMVPSAPATRSWTSRATSGTTLPYATVSSSSTRARPSPITT